MCHMYGKRGMQNTNDARFAYFQQYYAPKHNHDQLERIKGINPACMPPCQNALFYKILRSNCVAYTWRNAHLLVPCSIEPLGQGWILQDENYHFKWFDCEQVPRNVCQVLGVDMTDEVEDTVDYHGSRDSDSDSEDEWE